MIYRNFVSCQASLASECSAYDGESDGYVSPALLIVYRKDDSRVTVNTFFDIVSSYEVFHKFMCW